MKHGFAIDVVDFARPTLDAAQRELERRIRESGDSLADYGFRTIHAWDVTEKKVIRRLDAVPLHG